jgi:4-hydroxybenzoate polyprenyltransferase
MVGEALGFGLLYQSGLLVAALIAIYHFFLIRDRDRMQCFKAFRHNNWFGAAIFLGIVAELNLKPLFF